MKQPNFTECAIEFLSDTVKYSNYTYTGRIDTFFTTYNSTEKPSLISLTGCEDLCGTGSDYYDWSQVSGTISTWGMPLIGLILQAPFDSNEFRKTMLALARWIGSPIVALSYIFWNIRVTGKCAVMVDMSTSYEDVPDKLDIDNEYAQIRDSFYILSVMNQYSYKKQIPDAVAGEKLLRAALFSDTLKEHHQDVNLAVKRQDLAESLRDLRKKGVVPVFISLGWFIFSMIVSIQAAWGQLGANATAHNLAMGLLTAWLPVLILCCIVDRNPAASEAVQKALMAHIKLTRETLVSRQERQEALEREEAQPHSRKNSYEAHWTYHLKSNFDDWDRLFNRFAGQGRVRFHYGVAQPIIRGIEQTLDMQNGGRGWLSRPYARRNLIDGRGTAKGLALIDKKEVWQLISAHLIVFSTVAGAFVVSFFTPTVGLGCRSGGYMVFYILAVSAFVLEYACWWITKVAVYDSAAPELTPHLGNSWKKLHTWWNILNSRTRFELLILRPIEIVNASWLVYILVAQTFGSYETCKCMASVWGFNSGYIDFHTYSFWDAHHKVFAVWTAGTASSLLVMLIAYVYIVWEWCEQSHLMTSDYQKARRGLIRTRHIKHWTLALHNGPRTWYELTRPIFDSARRLLGFQEAKSRNPSLTWSGPAKNNSASKWIGSKQQELGSYDQLNGGESEMSKGSVVIVDEIDRDHGLSPHLSPPSLPRRRTEERLLRRSTDEEMAQGFGLTQLRSPATSPYLTPTHETPDHLGMSGIERYYSDGGNEDYFPTFDER